MRLVLVIAFLFAGPVMAQQQEVYCQTATTFTGAESPLSEHYRWIHELEDWNVVEKDGGVAMGTDTTYDGYDDSYALIDDEEHQDSSYQFASAVVRVDEGASCSPGPHEVELLFRCTETEGSPEELTCYEALFSCNGCAYWVRWNGEIGDFTPIGQSCLGSTADLQDGDVIKATVVGDDLTAWVNDETEPRATAEDSTFDEGKPGIGFFGRDDGGETNSHYTLDSYVVRTYGVTCP